MIPSNRIRVITGDNCHKIINFYKAMYESYKGNIGNTTISGNKITEKMVLGIRDRMIELMGRELYN
jgi:hypothetical protein